MFPCLQLACLTICLHRHQLKLKMGAEKTESTAYVTVHEKTRYKLKIAILDNAHLKVQTLCYFMLKPDLPNGDKITSV